jgi:hypothetical protein
MTMRNLVISLGITTLSSFLIYMYFRNRMSDVESKVDIMFQLIQEHTAANDAAAAAAALQNTHSQNNLPPSAFTQESYHSETSGNLVDVSDDEDGGSSSEEVSDDEDDEDNHSTMPQLDENDLEHLRENIFEEVIENVKKINLNIHGSETSSPKDSIILNNLDDLKMVHGTDSIHLDTHMQQDIEEVTTNELVIDDAQLNLTKLSEESPEINDSDESDNQSDENNDLNDIILEELPDNTAETITVSEEVILNHDILRKKTVSQLKEIAAQKNLQKYKSLTKKRLIDLISNSQ